jgi:hypothetical protein
MTENAQPGNKPPQLQLELPPDLDAIYVNLVGVSYTPGEFILDFGRTLPGQRTLKVLSRLLMSPLGAKMFYQALGSRLVRYEATFGEIKMPGQDQSSLADELFRSLQPPDGPSKD